MFTLCTLHQQLHNCFFTTQHMHCEHKQKTTQRPTQTKQDIVRQQLDAYIVDTDDTALDITIWNADASEILGVSYPEFVVLDESDQRDKLPILTETEYNVYLDTKVNNVFKDKKTLILKPIVRKIEMV